MDYFIGLSFLGVYAYFLYKNKDKPVNWRDSPYVPETEENRDLFMKYKYRECTIFHGDYVYLNIYDDKWHRFKYDRYSDEYYKLLKSKTIIVSI
jgi:hypothetical protein